MSDEEYQAIYDEFINGKTMIEKLRNTNNLLDTNPKFKEKFLLEFDKFCEENKNT